MARKFLPMEKEVRSLSEDDKWKEATALVKKELRSTHHFPSKRYIRANASTAVANFAAVAF